MQCEWNLNTNQNGSLFVTNVLNEAVSILIRPAKLYNFLKF